ncbi:fimbrial protein [Acetobacter sp. AN02]|uniref:fimbrial protein n=1 Tax=Acetobacter sp. AN02 TaxID=2894186 RepID=UPI0024343FAF|nr:fimbrial protein [Acetobacter sp. AN02]MDG6094950.1 fimbrial protein [Acetobacter sp. AN02]
MINNIGAPSPDTYTPFPTNIPGIGYMMFVDNSYLTSSEMGFTSPAAAYPDAAFPSVSASQRVYFKTDIVVDFRFVKTGDIILTGGNNTISGTIASLAVNDLTFMPIRLSGTMAVTTPSCSVSSPSANVSLSATSVLNLPSVGSTAQETPFSIDLNCTASMSVNISFVPVGTASGITGVLLPTSGTAKGVGIRLTDTSRNPVSFSQTFSAGTSSSGSWSVPLLASYYRTGALSAGSLSAGVTFTLSYP